MDITDRTALQPLGRFEIPLPVLRVANGFAYLTGKFSGVRVVDVRDPMHPSLYAAHDETTDISRNLTVGGAIVYVADKWGGLQMLEVEPAPRDLFLPLSANRGSWW